jgi:hypothetical protein
MSNPLQDALTSETDIKEEQNGSLKRLQVVPWFDGSDWNLGQSYHKS